eukprot:g8587.t1 g8587   contig3:433256-434162(+)
MNSIVTLLLTWIFHTVATATGTHLRRGLKDEKDICLYLGRRYGYQTLTVPTDKYRFFTSSSRDPPADDGPCDPQDVKTLATAELKTQNYCRLFKHPSDEWCTVEAISAADTWLLSNGFERGVCIQKSSETFHMEHIREITNYDDLRNDLLNMIDGFSDQQLLDAENCLSTIADEQQHYCWNGEKCQDNADCGPRDMCAFNYWQEYIGNIGDVSHRLFNRRTCPDGTTCVVDGDCTKGGSCQDRND